MFTKTFTALLALAASALAYTTPTTFNETSNPVFTPNSGDIVPAGKPYKITWGPTESGTVSIILLRGPASNILPLYPIVEQIPNTGSYTWTPKTDLEDDTTHYGIQVIIDANGQYQYSTQFGISNPNYVPSSSSSTTAVPTTTGGGYGSEETTTSYETIYTTTKSSITSFVTVTTTSAEESSTSVEATSTYVAPTYTYVPPANNNGTTPTYRPTPSDTNAPPPPPQQTGAASSIKVASGLLLGVAGVAAMLF